MLSVEHRVYYKKLKGWLVAVDKNIAFVRWDHGCHGVIAVDKLSRTPLASTPKD